MQLPEFNRRFRRPRLLMLMAGALVVAATIAWLSRLNEAMESRAAERAGDFVDALASGDLDRTWALCDRTKLTRGQLETMVGRYKTIFTLPQRAVTYAAIDGRTAEVLVRYEGAERRHRVEIRLIEYEDWHVSQVLVIDRLSSP